MGSRFDNTLAVKSARAIFAARLLLKAWYASSLLVNRVYNGMDIKTIPLSDDDDVLLL